jgi:hypothetical protein
MRLPDEILPKLGVAALVATLLGARSAAAVEIEFVAQSAERLAPSELASGTSFSR